jgi:hypothetical protein
MSGQTDKAASFWNCCFWQAIVTVAVIIALTAWLLYFQAPIDLQKILASLVTVLLGLFAAVVLAKMYCGPIDLKLLVSEGDGSASMSRFQFLIFTFVIAASYLLLAMAPGAATLVDVPNGVLGLIGISGGSYVGSKVVQKAAETAKANSDAATEQAHAGTATAQANAVAAQANAAAAQAGGPSA